MDVPLAAPQAREAPTEEIPEQVHATVDEATSSKDIWRRVNDPT